MNSKDAVYLEILIEDASGKILLEQIMTHYIENNPVNYRIHSFKGIGHIPKKDYKGNPKTKRLLNDLPQYLQGFDKSLASLTCKKAIMVVVDTDGKDCKALRNELIKIYNKLNVKTDIYFCLAIEEMEAWLLGDKLAVQSAYPNCKKQLLSNYVPDSVVGTWERLADITYTGGVKKLLKEANSYHVIGNQKCVWANAIGIHMNIEANISPSFNYFLSKLNSVCLSSVSTSAKKSDD